MEAKCGLCPFRNIRQLADGTRVERCALSALDVKEDDDCRIPTTRARHLKGEEE